MNLKSVRSRSADTKGRGRVSVMVQAVVGEDVLDVPGPNQVVEVGVDHGLLQIARADPKDDDALRPGRRLDWGQCVKGHGPLPSLRLAGAASADARAQRTGAQYALRADGGSFELEGG